MGNGYCYNSRMRIVAIDPGYERLGVAVIERQPPKAAPSNNPPRQPPLLRGIKGDTPKREVLLYSTCIQTVKTLAHEKRLLAVANAVAKTIAKWKPDALAIETLFLATNHKTAMAVAEARGAILTEAARAGLTVYEYTPLQIKIAVTGYGKSDKRQVSEMVKRLVAIPGKTPLPSSFKAKGSVLPLIGENEPSRLDDEYDAIAVGLTCLASERNRNR